MIGGATKGKAIIIMNPAEPPLVMRDTVYTQVILLIAAIEAAVAEMVAAVQLCALLSLKQKYSLIELKSLFAYLGWAMLSPVYAQVF